MVKKVLGYTGILVAALWMVGTAYAAPLLTFMDLENPEPDIHVRRINPTHTYTHILGNGFNPLLHTLQTAQLTLDVRDDSHTDRTDSVTITFDGQNQGIFEIDFGDLAFTLDVTLLQSDGELQVTFTREVGDFLFRQSTLVAEGTTATPEPSTVLLLGSGLAGMVALGTRRRHKTALAEAVPQEYPA